MIFEIIVLIFQSLRWKLSLQKIQSDENYRTGGNQACEKNSNYWLVHT